MSIIDTEYNCILLFCFFLMGFLSFCFVFTVKIFTKKRRHRLQNTPLQFDYSPVRLRSPVGISPPSESDQSGDEALLAKAPIPQQVWHRVSIDTATFFFIVGFSPQCSRNFCEGCCSHFLPAADFFQLDISETSIFIVTCFMLALPPFFLKGIVLFSWSQLRVQDI